MSPGVCTIFQGEVTASFSGIPDGRQKLLGSSFPLVSMRLFVLGLGPGLERDFLQIRGDVDQVLEPRDQPDSTQVRLAIRQSRRRRGEIRLTILRSRYPRSGAMEPLRGNGRRHRR